MTPNQIRARLVEKGSSYRKFALARGYEPRNVTQVVARWAGAERLPNGRLAYAILKDLSEEIGADVVPGIRQAAGEQ
ncbi:TPA: hypothetical protein ACSPQS_000878 [Pseudomonas aeruginosa]|uniref:BcepMu gp16 family phage-associated protein n=2 Tax=Pseudomonas aeruginosa TaxID=287 RepID=UPI0003B9C2B0|nr:BcepMu gp16 family phage-associated protein [Pseudomonas aeruginosa]AWT32065.1 hypothetical protein DCS61_24290 [Pseudomonas aeruginosa]EKU2897563.1 hypothetical protein [Pseudomonas aeruginosa]EMD5195503.1 hypothetical protein [Pseudomonas aeruginosa]ERV12404.1 BcepMu gp16 family phage-associated protein [Pseudomonas aeruginosa BL18]KAA2300459.1 hypothetical protein F1C11_00290 [Pseudomonas aeruginosa]